MVSAVVALLFQCHFTREQWSPGIPSSHRTLSVGHAIACLTQSKQTLETNLSLQHRQSTRESADSLLSRYFKQREFETSKV